MSQPIWASALLITATSSFAAPLAAADAKNDWKTCTETAARNYALTSSVPAHTVVETALGECRGKYQSGGEVPNVRDRQPSIDEQNPEAAYKTNVDRWRPQLVEQVVQIRKADQLRQ